MKKITSILQKLELSRNKKLQNKLLVGLFLFFGILIVVDQAMSGAPENQNVNEKRTESPSADTFIPAGYTLVPIEVVNSLQISPLLGSLGGQVDLYKVSETGRKSKLVYSAAKILRAPLDPEQFAVLVPATAVNSLLSESTRFFAVILNPNATKNPKKKKTARQPRRIEIEYQETL